MQDLYNHLTAKFRPAKVFMDIRNIHEGEDWLDAVRDEIESCHAVLVVMGRSGRSSTTVRGVARSTTRRTRCAWSWRSRSTCRAMRS